jgi:hypothetical protein
MSEAFTTIGSTDAIQVNDERQMCRNMQYQLTAWYPAA